MEIRKLHFLGLHSLARRHVVGKTHSTERNWLRIHGLGDGSRSSRLRQTRCLSHQDSFSRGLGARAGLRGSCRMKGSRKERRE